LIAVVVEEVSNKVGLVNCTLVCHRHVQKLRLAYVLITSAILEIYMHFRISGKLLMILGHREHALSSLRTNQLLLNKVRSTWGFYCS
jgi:hypothetical protein